MSKKLEDAAKPAVENMLNQQPDDLYAELGVRLQAISVDPSVAGTFAPELPELQGGFEDFAKFGKQFFNRVSVQAYGLLCGTDASSDEQRKRILEAFTNGSSGVAALLATLLVAQLGLAPAIAAVVAALVIKLFFQPAYDATCEAWKAGLPQVNPAPANPAT